MNPTENTRPSDIPLTTPSGAATTDPRGTAKPGGRTSGTTDAASAAPAPAGRITARQWFALVLLMLPVLLVSVDNTVLSFALPAISLDLAPSSTTLLWIVDIYPLVLAGLLAPFPTVLGNSLAALGLIVPGLLMQDAWRQAFFAAGQPRIALAVAEYPVTLHR